MRHLDFSSLRLRHRDFKGLRGWSGKPAHPPLTDIPVAAYMIAAVLDLISAVGNAEPWSYDVYRAASYVVIAGAAVSLLTALTGFWDWLRSTEAGTKVRRVANAHAWTMVTVTVVTIANVLTRTLVYWDDQSTPGIVLGLSLAAAVLTVAGATIGGSLVFDYGFNVEVAKDDPAWHPDGQQAPDEQPSLDLTESAEPSRR